MADDRAWHPRRRGLRFGMWLLNDRKRERQSMVVQEVAEQMAMGHFETRLSPAEVPSFAAIAERFNMMADQAALLQQTQLEGTAHTSRMAQGTGRRPDCAADADAGCATDFAWRASALWGVSQRQQTFGRLVALLSAR